jgi:uncharacterized protein involved in exopolysaccharide biosynthesis
VEEPNYTHHNDNVRGSLTLRDLLAIGFRHRRLMVISFLTIFSGAIVAALLQPNQYDAGMKILVKRERVDPVITAETSALPQFALQVTEEEANSEVELLKSRDLLEKVAVACDLQRQVNSAASRVLAAISGPTEPRDVETNAGIARAVRRLAKDLRVEVVKKTNLIAVNYESPNPQLAARVLGTLADVYLEKHLAVHRPPGAFDFFEQQTQRARNGLADAEGRLVDFARSSVMVSPQLEKEIVLRKLAEFDATLNETHSAIAETQQRIRVLEEQAASTPARTTTQVRSSDDAALLSQLRANLLALELKHTELLGKFEPTYRPVQELTAQIEQTRAAIATAEKSRLRDETTDRDHTYEWVTQELAKAKTDLAGLQARAEAAALTVRSYRENARYLEQGEVVQDDLIRTVKATEDKYLLYLRKEEEARISDALDRRRIINVSIAEAATVPSLPSSHRLLTLLIGVLLAISMSMGLAFVSEYLDPTFRTPDELRAFLNIPVLASMPQNGKNGAHSNNGNGVVTHVS